MLICWLFDGWIHCQMVTFSLSTLSDWTYLSKELDITWNIILGVLKYKVIKNRNAEEMLKEPKQFCLKNWDLDVNWEGWNILKNHNIGEGDQLLAFSFLILDKRNEYKTKQEGSRTYRKKTSLITEDCSQIVMGHRKSNKRGLNKGNENVPQSTRWLSFLGTCKKTLFS